MKVIVHEPMVSYGLPKELVFGNMQRMDSQAFQEFCVANPDLNVELDQFGQIHLMSPVFFKGSNFEAIVAIKLGAWNEEHGLGYVTSSQGGYTLPNGAVRAPDAAWVAKERIDSLSEKQKESFPPLCPDFVVEIRSKSDKISILRKKMQEYIDNGVRLGFLIDPYAQTAWIYRANGSQDEVTDFNAALSGEDVLPGFSLSLKPFAH